MTDEDAAVAGEAQQVQALRAEVDQLREALESRDAIGQAKGIIRLLTHTDSGDAFELLARLSQNSNLKLRDAAVLIADCAGSGTPLPGPVAAVWRQLMSHTQPGDQTATAHDVDAPGTLPAPGETTQPQP